MDLLKSVKNMVDNHQKVIIMDYNLNFTHPYNLKLIYIKIIVVESLFIK